MGARKALLAPVQNERDWGTCFTEQKLCLAYFGYEYSSQTTDFTFNVEQYTK